jgi:sugar lactone lactonase YvrE
MQHAGGRVLPWIVGALRLLRDGLLMSVCPHPEAWLHLPSWGAMALLLLGGHFAASQELDYPISLAVHPSGALYLADRNLPGVWRLEGDRLSLFHQASKKFRTPLNAIRCVAVDRDGKLLAGDSATCDVYRFDESGRPQPLTAQGKPYGQIGIPMSIVADAQGDLLVSDLETHRLWKVPRSGGKAESLFSLPAPRGLFYDAQRRIWAISGRTLVRISAGGEKETVVGDGVFSFPHSVAVQENGTAFVADGAAKTIWKVAPGAKPEPWVRGEPLDNPVGLDQYQGKLLVADPRAKAVFEIDSAGKLTRRPLQRVAR